MSNEARTQKNRELPRNIDDLQFGRNARRHPERNVAMIQESIASVGAARSIVIDEAGIVLAGEGAVRGARAAGLQKLRIVDADGDTLIAVRRSGLTNDQKIRLSLFDNRSGEFSEWDGASLRAIAADGIDLSMLFTDDELADVLAIDDAAVAAGLTDPDEVPAARATSIRAGDVFELGAHRLMCGDSTAADIIEQLVGGDQLVMVHADPPYGMGKEADGIANDNLYRDKLDAFQMLWWSAWLPAMASNASVYVWGNAPDLWRLWYVGGLNQTDLVVRNEIVWDKGSGFGMASEGGHSYPPASERCLFLMRGQQFLGNQNKADYWDGYEPLRSWLEAERTKAGWSNGDVNAVTGTQMASHWFSRSQFHPIPKNHYETLQAAAKGSAFVESYDAVFDRAFGAVKSGGNAHRRGLAAQLRQSRTYFDNAHDAMTDVWQFPRVVGEDRFGHATPKPVALVRRALMSSSAPRDVVGVPFGGTCPEIIAAEQISRRVRAIECEPKYCQIIIDRWESFTGKRARKIGRR